MRCCGIVDAVSFLWSPSKPANPDPATQPPQPNTIGSHPVHHGGMEALIRSRPVSAQNNVPQSDDVTAMQNLIRGMAVSRMIGVVCKAKLPNALEDGEERPIPEIAQQLNVDAGVLRRLCRTLSSFGIFTVDEQDRIRHNNRSLLLREDRQPSLHWTARFWSLDGPSEAWNQLDHALTTGEEGFEHAHGESFFSYMNANPEQAEVYRQYMASGYPKRHEDIASAIKLDEQDRVVDVGGGTGALIHAILDKHPTVQGMVYDQPEVIGSITDQAEGCHLVAGSFFESVPKGGDVYILSYILHDWPDDKALNILRSCRAAMQEGARLLIVERLLEADPAKCDPLDLLLDMNMLVLHKGQERTHDEFNRLMAESGFSPIRTVLKQPTFSIFEASPVDPDENREETAG